MRSPSRPWLSARSMLSSLHVLLTAVTLIPNLAVAATYKAVPAPDLDLSGLGRVALAGDYDSISLYQYLGQNEDGLNANGSQAILGRFPTGDFTDLQTSDAYIAAMCPFVSHGKFQGIVVGGNFTSLGGQQLQAVALFDPTKNSVAPLTGLTGQVNAVYCDNERNTVYVGGMFSGGNSTNAIAWVDGWTNLPFAGFNGPVNSIDKLPNGNIVFGGSFTGIANMTTTHHHGHMQVINLGAGQLSASSASSNPQYSDPNAIICATPGKSGPGTNLLFQEGTPGSIRGDFSFGFIPAKIRLYNSQIPGYGVKTWRFTALPSGGILNFTFHDKDGPHTCTNECPLGEKAEYLDYYFVNPFGMSSFQIDISGWDGKGAGLSGLELFSDQIFAFAVNDINEPKCDDLDSGASSKVAGHWTESPAGASYSPYLTTELPDGTADYTTDSSVVFVPNIKQSGNYTIFMYTPGCVDDGTCYTRGQVNITGQLASSTEDKSTSVSTTLYQTNDYLKYDQIYYGYIEATTDSFKPTITLTPSLGQNGPLTVVAQSINFAVMSLISSTGESGDEPGGLNGLFEFDPDKVKIETNFQKSAIDSAGRDLDDSAVINSIVVDGKTTYAAGDFSSKSSSNILSVSNDKTVPLKNGGLNDAVQSLYLYKKDLYVGGNFSNTKLFDVSGLNGVAIYGTSNKAWRPLGDGVNGAVNSVLPLSVDVTGHGLQDAIAVSGYFTEINSFGSYPAIPVLGIAVWIPSLKNWWQNVDSSAMAITGQLNAYSDVPDQSRIWSGAVDSQMLGAGGVVSLTESSGLTLQPLPIEIDVSQGSDTLSKIKRAAASNVPTKGVVTGMFYKKNHLNITILGGQFSASAESGNGPTVSNLVFINGSDHNRISGLEQVKSDMAILAMDSQDTSLIAGASNGDVVIYDLATGQRKTPPPALNGAQSTIYAVAAQPKTSSVYVGGSFSQAGSLMCPALCIYNLGLQQWSMPGTGLSSSSTIHILEWASNEELVIAGGLNIKGKSTTLARYNTKSEDYSAVLGANTLPGPIVAYSAVDASFTMAFVAGIANSNNSAYLAYFNGDNTWTGISGLGGSSIIEGLQVLSLKSDRSESSEFLGSDQVLLITGKLELDKFGQVSAALYDGSRFEPFILSTLNNGSPGSISRVFVENTQNLLLPSQGSYLALGFIVLIGLACALGAVFLIVVIGIVVERVRRQREGYVPAPTGFGIYEKGGSGKIAPEELFRGVGPGEGETAGSRL